MLVYREFACTGWCACRGGTEEGGRCGTRAAFQVFTFYASTSLNHSSFFSRIVSQVQVSGSVWLMKGSSFAYRPSRRTDHRRRLHVHRERGNGRTIELSMVQSEATDQYGCLGLELSKIQPSIRHYYIFGSRAICFPPFILLFIKHSASLSFLGLSIPR